MKKHVGEDGFSLFHLIFVAMGTAFWSLIVFSVLVLLAFATSELSPDNAIPERWADIGTVAMLLLFCGSFFGVGAYSCRLFVSLGVIEASKALIVGLILGMALMPILIFVVEPAARNWAGLEGGSAINTPLEAAVFGGIAACCFIVIGVWHARTTNNDAE